MNNLLYREALKLIESIESRPIKGVLVSKPRIVCCSYRSQEILCKIHAWISEFVLLFAAQIT